MPRRLCAYTWWIHSLALSQMIVRTQSDRFVATRCINPNLNSTKYIRIYLEYNSVDTSSELGPFTPSAPLPQVYPPLN